MVKLRTLIEWLQNRTDDLDEDVEFIVVTKDGRIICMGVENQAKAIIKVLELFGSS